MMRLFVDVQTVLRELAKAVEVLGTQAQQDHFEVWGGRAGSQAERPTDHSSGDGGTPPLPKVQSAEGAWNGNEIPWLISAPLWSSSSTSHWEPATSQDGMQPWHRARKRRAGMDGEEKRENDLAPQLCQVLNPALHDPKGYIDSSTHLSYLRGVCEVRDLQVRNSR